MESHSALTMKQKILLWRIIRNLCAYTLVRRTVGEAYKKFEDPHLISKSERHNQILSHMRALVCFEVNKSGTTSESQKRVATARRNGSNDITASATVAAQEKLPENAAEHRVDWVRRVRDRALKSVR